MFTPLGKNITPKRTGILRGTTLGSAPKSVGGVIASSRGRAMATPMPRRAVRREMSQEGVLME